jgi:DNA-binding NarL/FixJ family response regulator
MTRILLVDDHRAVQVGIRELLLAEFPDVQVDFADSASSAVERLARGHWDIAVIEVNMRGSGGLELIPQLKQRRPQLRVLVYTVRRESHFGIRAFRCGADGFLTKDSAPESLYAAVRQLLAGRRYISPNLAEQLANAAAQDFAVEGHEALSDRDFEVMQGLAAGKNLTELAAALEMNIKTVSTCRSRIYETLNLKTQADLIRYAIEHDLLHD